MAVGGRAAGQGRRALAEVECRTGGHPHSRGTGHAEFRVVVAQVGGQEEIERAGSGADQILCGAGIFARALDISDSLEGDINQIMFYAHSRKCDVEIETIGTLRPSGSGWRIDWCSFPLSAVIDIVPEDVVLKRPAIVEVRI